jgi:predicted NBD/HSP70 family sugar kinase
MIGNRNAACTLCTLYVRGAHRGHADVQLLVTRGGVGMRIVATHPGRHGDNGARLAQENP